MHILFTSELSQLSFQALSNSVVLLTIALQKTFLNLMKDVLFL